MNTDNYTSAWERIISLWESPESLRNAPSDVVSVKGITSYSEGINLFIDTALMIVDNVLGVDKGVQELLSISERYGNPFILQEWLHNKELISKGGFIEEKKRISDISQTAGRMAAKRKMYESNPVKVEVLNLIETVSAVAMDSVSKYPDAIGNALTNDSVVDKLKKVQDIVNNLSKKCKTDYVSSTYKAMYGTSFK